MKEYSKSEKRRLRELAGIAYEREMKESLSAFIARVDDWKAGKITSLELSQLLHRYDYGESRKLWAVYQSPRHDMLVARAIAIGLLSEKEAGNDVVLLLKQQIAFYIEDSSREN
jgi:hypothetical protein